VQRRQRLHRLTMPLDGGEHRIVGPCREGAECSGWNARQDLPARHCGGFHVVPLHARQVNGCRFQGNCQSDSRGSRGYCRIDVGGGVKFLSSPTELNPYGQNIDPRLRFKELKRVDCCSALRGFDRASNVR
jgi:hypothetical protein